MSKKHFIELADALRRLKPFKPTPMSDEYFLGALRQWESTRDAMADFCHQQNHNFMRERWLAYIDGTQGPNGGKL